MITNIFSFQNCLGHIVYKTHQLFLMHLKRFAYFALLCIVLELAGGGSMAVAVGIHQR